MLLLKETPIAERVIVDISLIDDDEGLNGIKCPQCAWRPQPASRWRCHRPDGPEPPFDACGTAWNTFSTRGRCPGCAHQWRWTSCLRCGQWSLHVDWYEQQEQRH